MVLRLNKLVSPALYQIWLKFAQWFWRRRRKWEKFWTMTTTTMDNNSVNGQQTNCESDQKRSLEEDHKWLSPLPLTFETSPVHPFVSIFAFLWNNIGEQNYKYSVEPVRWSASSLNSWFKPWNNIGVQNYEQTSTGWGGWHCLLTPQLTQPFADYPPPPFIYRVISQCMYLHINMWNVVMLGSKWHPPPHVFLKFGN